MDKAHDDDHDEALDAKVAKLASYCRDNHEALMDLVQVKELEAREAANGGDVEKAMEFVERAAILKAVALQTNIGQAALTVSVEILKRLKSIDKGLAPLLHIQEAAQATASSGMNLQDAHRDSAQKSAASTASVEHVKSENIRRFDEEFSRCRVLDEDH